MQLTVAVAKLQARETEAEARQTQLRDALAAFSRATESHAARSQMLAAQLRAIKAADADGVRVALSTTSTRSAARRASASARAAW